MKIRVSCSCGKTLSVPETAAGKRVKCPGCSQVLSVPLPETPAEAEEPDEWIADDSYDPYQAATRPAKPIRKPVPSAAVASTKKRQLSRNGKALVQLFTVVGSLGCVLGFRPNGVLLSAMLGAVSAVVCAAIAAGIAGICNMYEE